jgi:hypothetical protein
VTATLVRDVTRDGHLIARLRCYDDNAGGSMVDAEVLPPGAAQPVRRGPYRFADAGEAFRFVQEALLTLQYLGCTTV